MKELLLALLAAAILAADYFTNALTEPCTTDSECAAWYGGNGDPAP